MTEETKPLLSCQQEGARDVESSQHHSTSRQSRTDVVEKKPITRVLLLGVMVGLILLGSVNFVTLKITYSTYGDDYAYFVSQAVNVLYLLYGGFVLYPLMCFTNDISVEERTTPGLGRKFFTMGVLDCCGTFLTAMGNVHTPGQFQPVLNQTLIPMTMFFSWFLLKRSVKGFEAGGAVLILMGALISVMPSLLSSGGNDDVRWYSVLLYFCSNVPMALSAVYKESSFQKTTIHVYYLTQWVSFWQLLFGFVLMPLQIIPGFGSEHGTPFNQLGTNLYDGARCYLHLIPSCAENNAFWLLTGYTMVNFLFNTLGLFLTKHGTAVLNGMSYAILLPLTTIAFSFPFLGIYREHISSYTIGGLVCVLIGFLAYQHFSKTVGGGGDTRGTMSTNASLRVKSVSEDPSAYGSATNDDDDGFSDDDDDIMSALTVKTKQSSFQERVIGMGYAQRNS